MGFAFSLKGDRELIKKTQEAARKYNKALGAAYYELGVIIMKESKRLVPVDTGVLKRSGYVTMPIESNTGIRVELGYGGPATAYALVQHERTDFDHPGGGEAKFLERPFKEAAGHAFNLAQKTFATAFKTGAGAQRDSDTPTDPFEGQ